MNLKCSCRYPQFPTFCNLQTTVSPPLVEMLFIVVFYRLCEYVACGNY